MASVLGIAALMAAGLFVSGCSPMKNAAGGSDATGVYTLVSVNDAKVPTKISHDGVALEVRAGSFTINADGTCQSKMTFVPPNGNVVSRETRATYSRAGAKLTMQWKGAGSTIGTVDGDTFTMNNEGMILAYRK